jgi:hypothetical protein
MMVLERKKRNPLDRNPKGAKMRQRGTLGDENPHIKFQQIRIIVKPDGLAVESAFEML